MGKSQKRKGADFERKVADVFGTERVGLRGKPDGDDADVIHDDFYIQCKKYNRIAAYNWLKKTIDECPDENMPIVVAQQDNGKPFVMLLLDDFIYGLKDVNSLRDVVWVEDE